MVNIICTNSKHTWSKYEPSRVDTAYKQHLCENRIVFYDVKLILLKPIFHNFWAISLIIVPTSLCQKKSVIITQDILVDTWGDIKLYFECAFVSSSRDYGKMWNNGLKAGPTVSLIMFVDPEKVKFISLGLSLHHSTSCTLTYGHMYT